MTTDNDMEAQYSRRKIPESAILALFTILIYIPYWKPERSGSGSFLTMASFQTWAVRKGNTFIPRLRIHIETGFPWNVCSTHDLVWDKRPIAIGNVKVWSRSGMMAGEGVLRTSGMCYQPRRILHVDIVLASYSWDMAPMN